MVCIDFLAHDLILGRIDAHRGTHASETFGQRDRGTAMQKSIGLHGARIHRHGAADEVRADFGEQNTEILDQGPFPVGIQVLDGSQVAPNAHSLSFSFAATRRYASRNGMPSLATSAFAAAAA